MILEDVLHAPDVALICVLDRTSDNSGSVPGFMENAFDPGLDAVFFYHISVLLLFCQIFQKTD